MRLILTSSYSPIVPCLVRYKIFFLPVVLLCQYEWWRGYFSSAIPHNMFSIEVDPDIFGFLLEILISPSGMIGTEPGMNLVIITAAMAMALAFGMGDEFNKLSWTFRRYLVQRLLYRNPYQPDIENILDHDYFVYRSEELYRSYRMVCLHEQLASVLSPVEIAILYWLVIPQDLWPALTDTFEDHFNWLIEFIALRHGVSPEHRFFDIYRELFREAGYLAPGWLRQPPAPIPHPTNDATVPPNDLHDEGEFHIPNPFEHAQYPATHSGVKIHLDVPDLVASPIARPSSAPAVIMTSPLSNDNALVNDTSEEAKEKALLAELFEPLD